MIKLADWIFDIHYWILELRNLVFEFLEFIIAMCSIVPTWFVLEF